MHIVMFDPSRIALQEELRFHPELCELIAKHPASEFELRIAEIAAYCDILLDGYYTPDELSKLCGIMAAKLYERRTQLILPRVVH